MPSPTETKPTVEEDFDLLAFWIQHKNRIVILLVLLVAGLIGFGISELVKHRARESASRDLADAKIADDYRRVATQHAGQAAAGNALLLLADKLRRDGKLDESSTALREFIDKYPDHQLIGGAWMSLGENLEAQGKVDEALANYQKVATSYSTGFSAPAALMGQARIFKAKGQIDEAKRAYEKIITQYRDNIYGQLAEQENRLLKK